MVKVNGLWLVNHFPLLFKGGIMHAKSTHKSYEQDLNQDQHHKMTMNQQPRNNRGCLILLLKHMKNIPLIDSEP